MVPQVKPGPDGGVLRRASCKSTHDLQSPPNKREKNCTHGAQARPEQRHSCHLVCDSSDGLLLGGWERYTEVAKRGGQHTLPALSRATAPTDPNYIILAPLNPGSQVWKAGLGKVRAWVPVGGQEKTQMDVGRSLQGEESVEQGGGVCCRRAVLGRDSRWVSVASGHRPRTRGCHKGGDCTSKEGRALHQSALFHSGMGCCVVGGESPVIGGVKADSE